MTDEQFSKAFKAAAPTVDAAPSGIVEGARRKRRRNRTAGVALAVALVAAVATPLALQFGTGDDVVLATPSPTPSATQTASPVETTTPELPSEDTGGLTSQVCADVQAGRVAPDTLPHTRDLPDGAARAWLCGDLVDPFGGVLGPREPLLTDPDRVVDAINALVKPAGWDDDMACTLAGGLTFHVVVDYSDGDRKVIAAETANCSWVGGWGQRSGGGQLLAEILPLWEQQRQTLPPWEGEPALCDGFPRSQEETLVVSPPSFLSVELSDLSRGVVCGLAADAPDFSGEVIQRWLPDDVVARIADGDLTTQGGFNPGLPYLVMLSAHGDPYPIYLTAEAASTPWLAEAFDGIRTEPFYVRSSLCSLYDADAPAAELADVTSGVACLGGFAVPDIPADLSPELLARITTGFQSEAAYPSHNYGGMNEQSVTLVDDAGRFLHLYVTVDGTGLITDRGLLYWRLPDDVRTQLEAHGVDLNR